MIIKEILKKLSDKEYKNYFSFKEDIRKLNLSQHHPIIKFIKFCLTDESIGELMFVKYLSQSDIFNKSLSVVIRVALYLDTKENTNYEIYFDKEKECPMIKSLTFFKEKGSLMISNVPNKNIINFSYAVKMNKGLPCITGTTTITQYYENTNEIFDSLFSLGKM